jgi:hypothetical protein
MSKKLGESEKQYTVRQMGRQENLGKKRGGDTQKME